MAEILNNMHTPSVGLSAKLAAVGRPMTARGTTEQKGGSTELKPVEETM